MNVLKFIFIIVFPINIYGQYDFNYIARSSAYDICKCVNNIYRDIDEKNIDLIIQWHSLTKYEFIKLMNDYSKSTKESFDTSLKIFQTLNHNECVDMLYDYFKSQEVNVIDSDNHQIKYIEEVIKYLSYNYNCKLTQFIIENLNDMIFDYTPIKWYYNDKRQPTGVLLQISNGDTQYMTIDNYNKLIEK
jgi:hypothetical protein